MYYSGTLSIDPAELTHLEIVPPTKLFAKFLHSVTGGLTSEREERETFTAVSILQQLNIVLREMGITNLVRLAKDDFDFYFDKKGKRDDLKKMFENFKFETDDIESEVFETLYLVVEHEDDLLKYLIEIDIRRRHKPDEAPIDIKINGIMKGQELAEGHSGDDMERQMESVFESQDAYNAHVRLRQTRFDAFLHDFAQKLRQFIKVDHIALDSNARIITPVTAVEQRSDIRYFHHVDPVYYGYYGFTDAWFHAWVWSSMARSHGVHIQNCDLVNESGQIYRNVGAKGIDAGDDRLFDPDLLSDTSSYDGGSSGDGASDSGFGSLFGSVFDGGGNGGGCGGGCGGCGG